MGKVDGNEQEPLAIFAADKVALSLGSGKPSALVAAHDVGHEDATGKRQERDAVERLERRDALIVRNRRERSEVRALGLVPLVRTAYFGDATHSHLRRQSKLLAQCRVVRLLQRDLVRRFERERFTRKPIGGLVKTPHRGFQFYRIVLRREQLQLNRYDHQPIIAEKRHPGKPVVRLLPALKDGASGAAFR